MTEEKAKEVLRRSGPPENVADHIEALHVALQVLGNDATMREVWQWAEGRCSASEKVVK